MTASGLVFHHFGWAVNSPETAAAFCGALGYEIAGPLVEDPLQAVNLQLWFRAGSPLIEIIWPSRSRGPLDGVLRQNPHGGVYHVCYSTRDLEFSLQNLRSAGLVVTCISGRKPAALFEGRHVSFYIITNLGLIEILEI